MDKKSKVEKLNKATVKNVAALSPDNAIVNVSRVSDDKKGSETMSANLQVFPYPDVFQPLDVSPDFDLDTIYVIIRGKSKDNTNVVVSDVCVRKPEEKYDVNYVKRQAHIPDKQVDVISFFDANSLLLGKLVRFVKEGYSEMQVTDKSTRHVLLQNVNVTHWTFIREGYPDVMFERGDTFNTKNYYKKDSKGNIVKDKEGNPIVERNEILNYCPQYDAAAQVGRVLSLLVPKIKKTRKPAERKDSKVVAENAELKAKNEAAFKAIKALYDDGTINEAVYHASLIKAGFEIPSPVVQNEADKARELAHELNAANHVAK